MFLSLWYQPILCCDFSMRTNLPLDGDVADFLKEPESPNYRIVANQSKLAPGVFLSIQTLFKIFGYN